MADQANACQQRAELFPELVIFDLHNRFSSHFFDLHHSAEGDSGTLEGYLELEYNREFLV